MPRRWLSRLLNLSCDYLRLGRLKTPPNFLENQLGVSRTGPASASK